MPLGDRTSDGAFCSAGPRRTNLVSANSVRNDLHYLELVELAVQIRARDISPVAVTRAQLDRIGSLNGTLGSYALIMADVAMAQAEQAEAEIDAGRYRGRYTAYRSL
jgi:hypothetical protein